MISMYLATETAHSMPCIAQMLKLKFRNQLKKSLRLLCQICVIQLLDVRILF